MPHPKSNAKHGIAKASLSDINGSVQFEFHFGPANGRQLEQDSIKVGPRQVPLRFVHHHRARRYVLRLYPNGGARVTVPRGGSLAEARRFAQRNVVWLERQFLRQATQPAQPQRWLLGVEVLFRGESVRLETGGNVERNLLRFGTERLRVANIAGDLRSAVERHLWRLAARELPGRVFELAALHRLPVRRVTVRNQRSRWGSCSRRGTISLNWRLLQTPAFVRDYIVLHELAHLKEMNHSQKFWRLVASLCPDFARAERWLKNNSNLLN